MKKILTIALASLMVLSLASCGSKKNDNADTTISETTPQTDVQTNEETKAENTDSADGALSVIDSIWSKYAEEEMFPCGGGDSENMNFEGPASFDITKTDELDSTLGLPASLTESITDAASFMHMMNANTFTGACYTLKEGTDASEFAKTLKDNILSRQWICGIPETLIIINVDGTHILSAFGASDIINTLKTKTEATFSGATIMVETAVTE
jgi:hypothetical protein